MTKPLQRDRKVVMLSTKWPAGQWRRDDIQDVIRSAAKHLASDPSLRSGLTRGMFTIAR